MGADRWTYLASGLLVPGIGFAYKPWHFCPCVNCCHAPCTNYDPSDFGDTVDITIEGDWDCALCCPPSPTICHGANCDKVCEIAGEYELTRVGSSELAWSLMEYTGCYTVLPSGQHNQIVRRTWAQWFCWPGSGWTISAGIKVEYEFLVGYYYPSSTLEVSTDALFSVSEAPQPGTWSGDYPPGDLHNDNIHYSYPPGAGNPATCRGTDPRMTSITFNTP